MRPKFILFVGSLSLALAAGSAAPLVDNALAACSTDDVIDRTTAAEATKAMERAGCTQVKVYENGCDNAWHAHAILTGNRVSLVWNREGQIFAVIYSPSAGQFWL